MQPFFLKPDLRHYLWGGHRLSEHMDGTDEELPLAERWELAARPDANTTVAGGELAGLRFGELVVRYPELVGRTYAHELDFPVLVKLLDTRQANSIQVHPDDAYARNDTGECGKNEMWLILDCDKDAFIYAGFSRDVGRDEVRRRVADGTLDEVLGKLPVRKGDFYFIPAGTVHSIGAGILLAEVQQNSDLTYRLYDFGRLGLDGKPRPLHVDKALEVARLGPACLAAPGARTLVQQPDHTLHLLAATSGFAVEHLQMSGDCAYMVRKTSFAALLCVEGEMEVQTKTWRGSLPMGHCLFLPAGSGRVRLRGHAECLIVKLT